MRLTFLGTSSGVPTKQRGVSGIAVHYNKEQWLLVDCGDGTLRQLLLAQAKLAKLQMILITHLHGDHVFGLAALLSAMNLQHRQTPLTIIAPKALIKLLDTYTLVCDLVFDFVVDFVAVEELLELPSQTPSPNAHGSCHTNIPALSQPYCRHGLSIQVIALSHRMPSYAFRLDNAKQTVLICGDNDNPDLLTQAAVGVDVLVHEATYSADVLAKVRQKFDPKHVCAKAIAQFSQKNKVPNLILTHFSPRFAPFFNINSKTLNLAHLKTEAEQYYHGNVVLAQDFMVVDVVGERMNIHLPAKTK